MAWSHLGPGRNSSHGTTAMRQGGFGFTRRLPARCETQSRALYKEAREKSMSVLSLEYHPSVEEIQPRGLDNRLKTLTGCVCLGACQCGKSCTVMDWQGLRCARVQTARTRDHQTCHVGLSIRTGSMEQSGRVHWELKEGLAPFTPRIDPVLQRLRERCAHLLPCGKTNTDASRNKKRWFSRGQKLHTQQRNFLGLDARS
ncbi:hypothetical protein NQZ68_040786 [Dissostichus eleginoides]|nr:hypothetical protein NQZ68_040786 [Dissostichus eleginoides]